jgi:hypothetical protein
MNTKLYTGNGSVRTETGVGFQPDFTWIKDRTGTNAHVWTDAVRGANYQIYSNLNNAQTNASGYLTAFASDGFTLGTDGAVNQNSSNYVSWNWKANGAGSSNSDGDITATVSANTTAGFSIVKWTADGGNASGVGHGLSATPEVIIYKSLGTGAWYVWMNQLIDTSQDYVLLNATDTKSDIGTQYGTPSNTTISNFGFTNGANLIAYCFAEKKGYSKFGSYTGNGNVDGTFVYTGFKPAFVMIKNYTTGAYSWTINDTARTPHNVMDKWLYPNINNAEATGSSYNMDLYSNGFKSRNTGSNTNDNNNGYFYMAFAEEPLVANVGQGIPATAR